MNGLRLWAHSELRRQNVQTFAATIIATKKLLDFWGEPKTGPRNNEEAQSDKKQQGKWKKKDKGNMKKFKGSEENCKKTNIIKEKKLISCWICAKEHYVKNCTLK